MDEYDELVLSTFLKKQRQLFPEKVASTLEEAEAFLSDCMAVVCEDQKEVREYFKEAGADIAQLDGEELLEAAEVFALPDGRFLVVEV